MRTSSRATALLLFDEVELLDVAAVASILSAAGRKWNFRPFKVTAVAVRRGGIETRSQVRVEATRSLSELPHPEVLVVPGGYGAKKAMEDAGVVSWLEQAGRGASELLGIGHGVLLLAKAGLLADQDVAVTSDAKALLEQLSPTSRPELGKPWCASGRVASARTSIGAARAALHVTGKVLGEKHATEIEKELGLDAPDDAAEVLRIVLPG